MKTVMRRACWPGWAKYIARDKIGSVYAYSDKPQISLDDWHWVGTMTPCTAKMICLPGEDPIPDTLGEGDWRDSLHEIIDVEISDTPDAPQMREFDTGATRNVDTDKLDYEGFISPIVLQEFARYMHEHRKQADGKLRDSDNWQRGIPVEAYMKSLLRHVMDIWLLHRGYPARIENGKPVTMIESLMGAKFNVDGYAFELLKDKDGKP